METVRRENVIRCKLYRDKKKNEIKEGERDLARLTNKNNELKEREIILERTIMALRQKYIDLIPDKPDKPCDCNEGTPSTTD